MKVLLIGFLVPEETIEKLAAVDRFSEIAANKLQWNLVNGIEQASGEAVDLISSLPIHDYPLSPYIVVWTARWHHRQESKDIMLPFLNLLILKHLTRFASCFYHTCVWLIRNRGKSKKVVLVYGSHSGHQAAALAAVWLLGGKIANIVTDLPSDPPFHEGIVRTCIRKLDRSILLAGMRRMDGLIVLARRLAVDLAPHVRWLLMEGVVSLNELESLDRKRAAAIAEATGKEFVLMYSGGLNASYGVRLLMDAFALLTEDYYRLWLLGKGDMVGRVEEAARRDERIGYFGIVPNRDAVDMAMRATVLINPRPSKGTFTAYSFPSKILEYMMTGRPIISTRLSGIPEEYFSYLICLEEETPEGLAARIRMVASWERRKLNLLGEGAREFVKSQKNHIVQGERVFRFLESLH